MIASTLFFGRQRERETEHQRSLFSSSHHKSNNSKNVTSVAVMNPGYCQWVKEFLEKAREEFKQKWENPAS
uniref:Uncharacterized protein n=1 Tax=Romanomermis culicivorax TaxID=13658 RepID=A0A915KJT2_ROMCU